MKTKHVLVALSTAVAMVQSVFAQNLAEDFANALRFDPSYQAALAERNASMVQAKQNSVAYYPSASYNNTRLQTDTGSRSTFNINQPLIDLEKWAALEQAAPRTALAEANLMVKQQDLAMRLLKAANAIILANENIGLNQAKMDALNQQALAAKQKRELGQGTVTDQRDIEVKAAQARAQHLGLQSQLQIALKQYEAIVGNTVVAKNFKLPNTLSDLKLKPLQDYIDDAMRMSPGVLAARASEKLAQLDINRARGALLPTLSANYTSTKSNNLTNNYSGVVVNVPIQAGTWLGVDVAQANAIKAEESRKDVEAKARVEVERLAALVQAGVESLKIQKEAIDAAELSVEANRQSYQGGVRTAVDVINAIQTMFQVKSEYVSMATTQSENIINLMSLAGSEINGSIAYFK